MRKIYIRWMGAFRGDHPLAKSLAFELTREDEAACEPLRFEKGRFVSRIRSNVGILVKDHAIIKEFPDDCWSEYGDPREGQRPGRLYAHAPP